MSLQVGLLHTVPALAGDFETRVATALPGARIIHLADAWLLAEAIRSGVTEQVTAAVLRWCTTLAEGGADIVLVTCSSIGEVAEQADELLSIPVLRIDAPMADQAIEAAGRAGASGRVVALATQPSTLGPTARLLERAADGAITGVKIEARLCEGAAAARAAGDLATHDALVAARITECEPGDVIVLAQASMASAAGDDPRVLTSLDSGVAALAARARELAAER